MTYEVKCVKGKISNTYKFHDEYYALKTKEEKEREGFRVTITVKK